jgi:hypothetical protein
MRRATPHQLPAQFCWPSVPHYWPGIIALRPCVGRLQAFRDNPLPYPHLFQEGDILRYAKAVEAKVKGAQWTDTELFRFARAVLLRTNHRPESGVLMEETAVWEWAATNGITDYGHLEKLYQHREWVAKRGATET